MLNKKKWVLAILLLLAICVFGTFNLTPGGRLSIYFLLLLSTVGHFIFFRYRKFISKKIKFWYWVGLFLMLISTLTAHLYYGQSLVSGFVANVNFYNMGSIILFVYLFQKYRISLELFFSLLIRIGWVLLVLMVLMAIADFTFINESELTGKIVIVHVGKISKTLVTFLAIFCFVKFLLTSKYKYLIYSLLFFSAHHLAEIQRFALLLTLLIMGIGILKNSNIMTNLKFIIPAVFTILFASIYLFNTNEGTSIVERFQEASKIFSGDENRINDISTSIRISETEFAIERFKLHPLFGNGMHRASEFDRIIGEDVYFHVSDIGLFGVLYVFGILGLVVFFGQLNVLWHYFKLKPTNYYHFTIVLALLFMMLDTLLTSRSIRDFDTFFFYICLIQIIYLPNHKFSDKWGLI